MDFETLVMEIKPFKAFRFDSGVVGDVGDCVAPPYDVISDAQQQQFYAKSEYNIVRIIRGMITAHDDVSNNQYTRAADCFNCWIEKGVLRQDSKEAIYGYVQDFELDTAHAELSHDALTLIVLPDGQKRTTLTVHNSGGLDLSWELSELAGGSAPGASGEAGASAGLLRPGDDPDAEALLPVARRAATRRVVVKRPHHAPPLGAEGAAPSGSVKGKLVRYDLYAPADPA